jgi:hypothetical protein
MRYVLSVLTLFVVAALAQAQTTPPPTPPPVPPPHVHHHPHFYPGAGFFPQQQFVPAYGGGFGYGVPQQQAFFAPQYAPGGACCGVQQQQYIPQMAPACQSCQVQQQVQLAPQYVPQACYGQQQAFAPQYVPQVCYGAQQQAFAPQVQYVPRIRLAPSCGVAGASFAAGYTPVLRSPLLLPRVGLGVRIFAPRLFIGRRF